MKSAARISVILFSLSLIFSLAVYFCVPAAAVAQPDLKADGISVTTLYSGIANTVAVNVSNNTAVAVDNFSVRLKANGTEVSTQNGLSLPADNDPYYWPLAVSFSWTPASAGEYTLTAEVDPADTVAETDETNNTTAAVVTVRALSAVTVGVRVEGAASTLWNGNVTFITSSITDKQGVTHTVNHPTALGALAEAAAQGGFDYVVSSAWGPLTYLEKVAEDASAGLNGWLYRVNWQSPSLAAVDYTLADGDQVLFYYGGWDARPLKLSVDNHEMLASATFNLTVEQYDGSNWTPAQSATVKAGSHIFTTGVDGKVAGISLPPGEYALVASKESYVTCIRSNSQTVSVYVPLELFPGWNFISFPRLLKPGSDSAEALFSAVDTGGHSVFDYKPSTGWKALAADDTIAPLEGVWIFSSSKIELHPHFDTNPRAVPPTLPLSPGWNAIGYSDFASSSAGSTLTSVENQWTTLLGFDAETQRYDISIINNAPAGDPHAENNQMLPWKGYWLYMTAEGELAAISS